MRCYYMSDLHLEKQDFPWALPRGDVLLLAGDLCNATSLEAQRSDVYAVQQRERVLRLADAATKNFSHVLLVAGNHDHYDGIFDDTLGMLRRFLPGVTVLDKEAVTIGGIHFFGTTMWSDFEGRSALAMETARRGVGEYFFVKRRRQNDEASLTRLRPDDTLAEFDRSLAALKQHLAHHTNAPTVVIPHHAPSSKGLNPLHAGNGLDGAYFSDLNQMIASFERVPYWVHGHTHIRRQYRIGGTQLLVNCRGFEGRDPVSRNFAPTTYFDL